MGLIDFLYENDDFSFSNDTLKKENAGDPMILVQGIGKMRFSQAKKRINKIITRAYEDLLNPNIPEELKYKSLDRMIKNGTLEAYVNAVNDVLEQMES